MKKFLAGTLILLIVAGSFLVRDARAGLDTIFYGLTSLFFVMNFFIIIFGRKWARGLGRFQVRKIRKWMGWVSITGGLILFYPLLLSYFYGHDMYLSLSAPVKYLPLLFCLVFAVAFRGQQEWYNFFIFLQILSGISAGYDIFNYYRLAQVEYILRYADAGTVQRDFVFGLLLFLMFVIFFDLPKRTYWCLFAAAALCTWRTVLLGSRGPIVIVALVVSYSLLVMLKYFGLKSASKRIAGVTVFTVLLSIAMTNLLGSSLDNYLGLFQKRFTHTEDSAIYRLIEINEVWSNHLSLMGAGWGSRGDFWQATTYTFGEGGAFEKSFIHNLYLYLIWKIGLVGLILIIGCFVFGFREWQRVAKQKDKFGFIVFGLLLAWVTWSSVNMIWANASLNLLVSSWIGYLLSRNIYQNENINLSTSRSFPFAQNKVNIYNAVEPRSYFFKADPNIVSLEMN